MRTWKSPQYSSNSLQHTSLVPLKTAQDPCAPCANPLRPLPARPLGGCLAFVFLCTLLATSRPTATAQQNNARFSAIKPGMRNERLENEAIWLANKKAGTIKCDEEFIDAKITSEDWGMDYDMQGRLTGRHLHMELYGETRNGKCGMSHCVFRQKLQGDNTFSPRLKLVELGEFFAMECE